MMPEANAGITAEEKERQILETKERIEGSPLGQDEEFQILTGQGIEYKTGAIAFIVPPVKVRDYMKMVEFEERQRQAKNGADILLAQIDFISRYTKASSDELMDNLDKQDCEKIMAIMFYSWIIGKDIFKKKTLLLSEIWAQIFRIRNIAGAVHAG
jgi:hypothetical protein